METSTPKKAPRCKQCGGPTKGHAALGSKPGPKNCSNPPWAEDDAGAIGNVVGVIQAQADAAAKEQEAAEPGTTGDAGPVEEAPSSGRGTFVMLKPPLHKALTKLQPRKSVFSETDDEVLSEEAQANSFEMPSFEVGKRDVARERVESSSDAMMDVRKHVAGKVFAVCLCAKDRDCVCPGEVKFGPDPSALTAVVAAVAMFEDPVTQEDWRPALALARDGWTADRPNTLVLVPSIAAKGVAIKGKVVVEALRVVEVVKGRKVVDTKLTLKMDGVEIKLPAAHVKKGFKSPLVLDYLEAPIYQLDESADEASGADEEDEASIAEDEASIAEEEDLEDDEDVADMNDVSNESLKTKDDDMTEGKNESCGEQFKSASENEDDEEESSEEIEVKDDAEETKEEEGIEEDIEDNEYEENVDKDDAEETKEEEDDEETEAEDTEDEAEEDENESEEMEGSSDDE